ncbi:nitrate reductase molybdenum cofactor assembly chaperone [Burkholderia glumae]|uniref:nitrate reductase molybdenum cofactor assembly chaperone n=1 Tax=Burkholderia glumae TaxID=337 RepID=UPI00137388D2|nr:nitrate reductase molybdenum cofactor assembly chaperone [Burkholderia glumae]MCR1768615.1 nitrate reductase molybdenum cofactor assembly chaperone [Burkholderia glumae]QHP92992.1 nitrate reductase molybdenum cofactor assembly chaperone [Burkholderia glumae]QJP69240.1 nitrate reductase molybdenum cofactor assembly chaperone [Burkholderia glumae]QKM50560.1 Nitrate reductase molybdenum cofactor assembly chaperone NarJ [Burkholderia glumae]
MSPTPSDTVQPVAYAALSMLLDYPDATLLDALDSIDACLREQLGALPASAASLAGLARFYAYLRGHDLLTLQENHVGLFDHGRATSLHLFEHVHGESRDRGQAMVDLLQTYERHGLTLNPGELPDYLPVFLEYLSRRPAPEAAALLAETAAILLALAQQLTRRGSHYGFVLGALLPLAGVAAGQIPPAPVMPVDDAAAVPTPADLRELDASHADAPVRFGGAGAAACEPAPDRATAREPGAAAPDAQPIHFHARRPTAGHDPIRSSARGQS